MCSYLSTQHKHILSAVELALSQGAGTQRSLTNVNTGVTSWFSVLRLSVLLYMANVIISCLLLIIYFFNMFPTHPKVLTQFCFSKTKNYIMNHLCFNETIMKKKKKKKAFAKHHLCTRRMSFRKYCNRILKQTTEPWALFWGLVLETSRILCRPLGF